LTTTPSNRNSDGTDDGKPEIILPSNTKQILHGLSGYAKAGQMMAIMGASGSGKTSFLNVLG